MEFIARSATETSYGNTVRILAAPPAHDIACSFQAVPSFAPKERRAANRMTDNHQDDARLIAALESACGAQRVKLIFNSWNLQRIDNTDRSALEKRLGTTSPLIAGMGRDQASAS
jgi:hypothetical protein